MQYLGYTRKLYYFKYLKIIQIFKKDNQYGKSRPRIICNLKRRIEKCPWLCLSYVGIIVIFKNHIYNTGYNKIN